MKVNRLFIIGILVFLAVMFYIEYNLPKKFIWNPTFNQYDPQPFGSKIFDDVVSHSYPDGYSVSRETFYQLLDDSVHKKSILAVEQRLNLEKVHVESLLKLVRAGSKVMLVTQSPGYYLADTLNLSYSYGYFRMKDLREYVSKTPVRDSIVWVGELSGGKTYFDFYPHLFSTSMATRKSVYPGEAFQEIIEPVDKYITKDSLRKRYNIVNRMEILAHRNQPLDYYYGSNDSILSHKNILAVSLHIGEGEIILVSTPLLFTNYGMLDRDNAAYIFRLLSRLKGYPLVRLESYSSITDKQQSPLRFMLANRSLQWALYVGMILILFFMFFNAKRKQRAIPIVRKPDNKSLEFTKLIGTLYYQKKNYAGLVRMNYIYMTENLRRLANIDLENNEDGDLCERISDKTGLNTDKVSKLLSRLNEVVHNDVPVTDREMKQLIDGMNEIINNL